MNVFIESHIVLISIEKSVFFTYYLRSNPQMKICYISWLKGKGTKISCQNRLHCVKSVRIRSYSAPHFSRKCRKNADQNNSE